MEPSKVSGDKLMPKMFEGIQQDIDKLTEKTGKEARKINTNLKSELDSYPIS